MDLDFKALSFVALKTGIGSQFVTNVMNLIKKEQCTVPFVARYRKEVTGNLDEVAIRSAIDAYEEYEEREKRRNYILETLKTMEVLTPTLEKEIAKAETINQLEDIYAPYKTKKKSKAQVAKEKGLDAIAGKILSGDKTIDQLEAEFSPTAEVPHFAEALEGAKDILIEQFSHHMTTKEIIREGYWKEAYVVSEKRSKAEEIADYLKFKDFFEYKEKLSELKLAKNGHRFLALRRGMMLKILKVDIVFDEDLAYSIIEENNFPQGKKLKNYNLLSDLAKKAYKGAIHPSLDLEIKGDLKNSGDVEAIHVFGVNLKNLLLSPYLGAKAVMGVDPGVRTGCKIALIDETGKFLADFVIYPHEPQKRVQEAKTLIEKALEAFKIEYVAVGNGTYGRETLEFLEENILAIKDGKVKAVLTSESGASVYSASDIARKEFPDKDVTVRGAISIARRVQDPLAELVKIDPKSIGVGQYQHDVNQARLKKSLEEVVESCVNYVGVDLNTASAPLLSYVSGIGPKVAENIVSFREKKGLFRNRQQLLQVPRFSEKTFQQATGFLRIYQGENPLDATFVHPESYPVLEEWCLKYGISVASIREENEIKKLKSDKALMARLGEHTFKDIVASIEAKNQDPRTTFKSTEFSKKLRLFSDLKANEWYQGVVTNITKFGVFVDIGIKENGLVHISELSDHFVEDPLQVVKVGQEVMAKVLSVDQERKRISLSMKKSSSPSSKIHQEANSSGGKNHRSNENRQASFANKAFSQLKLKK